MPKRYHFKQTMFVLCAAMLSISSIGHVRGHDYRHPELNGWYESLHSGKGPCCNGSEAKRVDDADWESKEGHYRVRIDGEWVEVPNEAVVSGPKLRWSHDGVALLHKWSSEGALLHGRTHGVIASARRGGER
jgi:hypothetical protein